MRLPIYKKRHWIGRIAVLVGLVVLAVWLSRLIMRRVHDVFVEHIHILEQRQLKEDINTVLVDVIASIEYDPEALLTIEVGTDGYVSTIQYDSRQLQLILKEVIERSSLALQERGSFSYPIKMGLFTKNAWLANQGPSIDLVLETVPYMQGSLDMVSHAYGFNSTTIEIDLLLTVYLHTASPILSEEISITTRLPLILQTVQGKAPSYQPIVME